MSGWMPEVGERVIYDNGYDAPEDGVVAEVVSEATVRVRYDGDLHAKATYVRDLIPGVKRCTCSASHPLKGHGADPADCAVHGDPKTRAG